MENLKNIDKPLIIWIDKNINSLENQKYLLQLGYSNANMNFVPSKMNYIHQNEQNLSYDIQVFDNITDSINYIITLRFKDTFIIISEGLFNEFINILYQRLKDIYIIPYIIVFSSRKINFSLPNERYFKFVGVETKFEQVKKRINSYIEKIQIFNQLNQFNSSKMKIPFEDKLIFEQIRDKNMLLLPLFYKNFIDHSDNSDITENNKFIEKLIKTYNNEPRYQKLFDLIKIKNIPVELLSKYYARIYTIDGNFYRVIKTDLSSGNYERHKIYIPFIKTFYTGLTKGALKSSYGIELYRAQTISPQEIHDLTISKQYRLQGLPMSIVYSKSFLEFTKSKDMAEDFYNRFNKNAMFTLKTPSQESNVLAHVDIEELSGFENKKEVLFFPFCAFGINKFETYFDYVHGKNRYEIELIYLREYKDIYKSFGNKEERPPDTSFKKSLMISGSANENLKNAKVKGLSEQKGVFEKNLGFFEFNDNNKGILNNKNNSLINLDNNKSNLNNKILQLNPKSEIKQNNNIFVLPDKPPLIGLRSEGSNYFLTAILQCLSQIKELVINFKKNQHIFNIIEKHIQKKEISLTEIFKILIDNLWPNIFINYSKHINNYFFSLNQIINKLSLINPIFIDAQANNAEQLINSIITTLHEELNEKKIQNNINKNTQANQRNEQMMLNYFRNEFLSENQSIVSNIFFGTTHSLTQCSNCHFYLHDFEAYFILIFPLEEIRNYRLKEVININQNLMNISMNTDNTNNIKNNLNKIKLLQNNIVDILDCFEYNQKIENLFGENVIYCDNCKASLPFTLQTKLYNCPQVLILVIKRGINKQFNVKLQFYLELNLSKYIESKNSGIIFDLIGVIAQNDKEKENGHFLAIFKSFVDNNWYQDNNGLVLPLNNFNQQISNNFTPCILFYNKKFN